HVGVVSEGPHLYRPARRAQGARLRYLRGPGRARQTALPRRQHGTARARRLRAFPGGTGRGAGRMTAIILAAGVGKRLLAVSNGRPKCLVEIGGRSLLARLLESLVAAGVRDVVVVTGFGDEAVRGAIGDGPAGARLRYAFNPRFREGAILSLYAAKDA